MEFVDRKQELATLDRLLAGPSSLSLLYGQRRAGKTFLLQHRLADEPDVVYFSADETTAPALVGRLRLDVSVQFPGLLEHVVANEWGAVLGALCQGAALADRRLILVLDELQYALASEPALASILQRLFDQLRHKARLHIVLCGSALGVMSRLGDAGQPLYGRFDSRLRIRRFGFVHAAEFAPAWARTDQLLLYGTFGGLARHLAEVRVDASLEDNIARAMVNPHGALHEAPLDLLRVEHLSHQADAQAVLTAVASGENQFGTIASRTGLTGPRTAYVLDELLALEVLEKVVRFGDRAGSKYVRYRCADPLTAFWFRLVQPLRSQLHSADPASIVRRHILPKLAGHMGYELERIAQEATALGLLGDASRAAPYWSRDGQTDLDLVVDGADGTLWVVECKWRADSEVRVEDLQALRGHVARAPFAAGRNVRLCLVTAGRFASGLRAVAGEEGVVLVDADGLFEQTSRNSVQPEA